MKYFKKSALLALVVLNFIAASNVFSCTEIMLNYNNQYVTGRNFDWPVNFKYAFIAINPMGIHRQSNDSNVQDKQLSWTAKYGSITIDLAKGKDIALPKAVMSGMNQYGLSAAVLWLKESSYPAHPTQPTLATGLWAQYFLDNAKTVKEAIQLANSLNIEPTVFDGKKILLHLILHDATGDSAVMDYTQGKLHISHGKSLPIPALTNNSYNESMQNVKQYQGFGGKLPLPGGYETKERFVRAACFIKRLSPATSLQQTIAYTFAGLADTAAAPGTESPTVWSVVFDLKNKILYYRDIDNANIRSVNLMNFNLNQDQPMKVLILNNDLNGSLNNLFQSATFSNHDGYLIPNK